MAGDSSMATHRPPIPQPTFPPDLEQEIFETAALSHTVSIPTLMLVAWRVREWLEPLLYRTITLPRLGMQDGGEKVNGYPLFNDHTLSTMLMSKPLDFLARSVKNLCLNGISVDIAIYALSACVGVENLWISSEELEECLPLIAQLPLTRLYCDVELLFGWRRQIDFTHLMFQRITHLELFDIVEEDGDDPEDDTHSVEFWADLALIPTLTHLAFNDEDFLPLCPTLLRACTTLRVLGIMIQGKRRSEDVGELAKDPRFVVMYCRKYIKDWQVGVHRGIDYWTRAEDFVDKRRYKLIDPLQYEITEDESLNIE
ncbi:hypothetical protein C8R43DRAFT_1035233 [Mycena crocata]|nr:hypothetical protein C8R43DRAFT_1035233 [Mycena crocata]